MTVEINFLHLVYPGFFPRDTKVQGREEMVIVGQNVSWVHIQTQKPRNALKSVLDINAGAWLL